MERVLNEVAGRQTESTTFLKPNPSARPYLTLSPNSVKAQRDERFRKSLTGKVWFMKFKAEHFLL